MKKIIGLTVLLLLFSQSGIAQHILPASAVKQGDAKALQLKKITGTGQTTGHIATLTIANNSKTEVTVEIPPMYIPSSGNYQPYIVPKPSPPVNIPPKSSTSIPIYGYCADVSKPPVPSNVNIPIQDFISGIGCCTPEKWLKGTPPIVKVNTDGSLQPERILNLSEVQTTGPILLKAINDITDAFEKIKNDGGIVTPFSGNPDKEREAVIQQTFWIYTSGIQGKQYNKSDFKANTIKQYNATMPVPFEKTSEDQQTKIEKGVDDFWNTFSAVGVEAKVLAKIPSTGNTIPPVEKPKAPEPPVEKIKTGCTSKEEVKCNPASCVHTDIKIADSYGDEVERKVITDAINEELFKKADDTKEGNEKKYGLSHPPASAIALYEQNHIGGFTSAFAKTIIKKKDGSSDVVWSTQPLDVTAKGSKEATLSFSGAPNCTSFVSGVSLARVKSTSKCFDAVAGNDPNSLFVLKLLNEAGSIAIDVIISKGKGTTKKIKDIIEDKAKDALKDYTKQQMEDLFGDKIRKMAKEQGINLDDVDLSDLDLPDDEPGIEIIDIIPMKASVKAEGKGTLMTSVGAQTKTAEAYSGAFYNREKLEEKAKTVKTTGPSCKEVIVSDSKPGALTVKVNGTVNMKSQAEGNGFAEANVESMYAVVMVGVCFCDGEYIWDSYTDYGYYVKDNTTADAVNFEGIGEIGEKIGKMIEEGKIQKTQQAVQKALEEEITKWAKDHPLVWDKCK